LNTKLILPLLTGNKLLGFLSLGEKLSEEPYSKEDKELLLAVAQQTAIALDYAQLIQQVTEQEKLKREIEIAKQVQAQLFPQTLPRMQSLDYTGMCRAARGVGGDYYDFLLITPGKLGIALGDISGKGISAALLMASLQALLRSHAPSRMDQVAALAGDINRLMQSSAAPGKYATFFYALYHEEQQTFTYVNAGHIPPVIFHATGTVTRLGTGGMVIGMFADAKYCQETVSLQPGDIFLSFSDGVTEAMNAQEEEYGEEALCKLISENRDLSADRMRELIVEKTDEFVAGAPQHDDFTLVIAKVL
jgi:phosphoserine phosphatase RsbU/P